MREASFVDESTEAVLGTREYVSWLTPDSPRGIELARSISPFGPGEAGVWQEHVDRTIATETWAESNPEAADSMREALSNLPDLARAIRRLRIDETLDEAELFAIKRFLFYARAALDASRELLERDPQTDGWVERVTTLMEEIHPGKSNSSRFHLASALDEDLAAARKELRALERRQRELREDLEASILEQFDGKFDIRGHFRPAASCNEDALHADARLTDAAGAWQLSDPALEDLRRELGAAEEAVDEHEAWVRADLTDMLEEHEAWLRGVEFTLAEVDLQLAKARLRERIDGCWPTWSDDDVAGRIVGGRDFGVLRILEGQDESVQPVDVALGDAPTVLSGPNMGGKSALLRLIGLCQWAAQHALPVPAQSYSFTPVQAVIYVGSEEPTAERATEGLSSFGREVRRLVDWWDRGDAPRLWLLDEVGRGTHPDEGARIAVEIIEQLDARGDRCIAATHFPAVASMEGARTLRIAGLTDPSMLDQLADADADDVAALQKTLRAAMDYRPMPVEDHDVPRDARVVARALGLSLKDGDESP
jgi:DNA mismatch repair ATPase MutS